MAHCSSITNQNALAPTIVRTIHEAFDDAVKTLETHRGPCSRHASERMRSAVARRIVDLAKHGECDFGRLRNGALDALYFAA